MTTLAGRSDDTLVRLAHGPAELRLAASAFKQDSTLLLMVRLSSAAGDVARVLAGNTLASVSGAPGIRYCEIRERVPESVTVSKVPSLSDAIARA